MRSANKYMSTLWKDHGVLPTWQPDRHLRIGDIISRDRHGVVRVETHITELSNETLPRQASRNGKNQFRLERGVSFSVAAAAHGAGSQIDAHFTSDSSYFMVAEKGTIMEYEHLEPLRRIIRNLDVRAKWERPWEIVTMVETFSAMTLALASSSGDRAAFDANAAIAHPALAGVQAGGSFTSNAKMLSTWSLGQCTPHFEGLTIRRERGRRQVAGAILYETSPSGSSTTSQVVGATPPLALSLPPQDEVDG